MSCIKPTEEERLLYLSLHASDCATHNAPAYPPGKCDCGIQKICQFTFRRALESQRQRYIRMQKYPGMPENEQQRIGKLKTLHILRTEVETLLNALDCELQTQRSDK